MAQRKQRQIDSIAILLDNAKTDSLIVRHSMELGILQDKSEPLRAERFFKKSLDILQGTYSYTDKFEMIALAYDCLGIIERRRNNYDKAMSYYLEGMKVKEQSGNSKKIGRSYHNIAILYREMHDFENAVLHMEKALPLRKHDSISYGISLNNYGIVYRMQRKYERAVQLFDSAKVYFGDHIRVADVNNNIANVYSKQKRHKEALAIQQRSIRIQKKYDKEEWLSHSYRNAGAMCRRLRNLKDAVQYLDSAEQLARKMGDRKLLGTIYRERYKIENVRKNYYQSLQYYRTYKKYQDSVYSVAESKKLKQLELDYQFKKEVLTDSLNYAAKKAELVKVAENERTQKQWYVILLVLAFILLIVLFLMLNFRRKLYAQSSQRKEAETQLLNEKVNFSRYQIERLIEDNRMRTSFNTELIERIKQLKNNSANRALLTEYQSILAQLQNQAKAEKRLDGISKTLLLNDQTFELKLSEKFPELTKSERDVCLLIHLNLSSKEIMNLRGMSQSSIKSIRHRIRKKLEVPKGEELELFIKQLML